MNIFPIDWQASDVDNQYTIAVFGKSTDGQLVAAHIAFFPYFYVELPAGSGPGQTRLFITEAVANHGAIHRYCRTVERVSLWGFSNNSKLKLVQLAFPTLKKLKWAARAFHHKKLTTYESTLDPLLRFYHIRDISPASWITITSYTNVSADVASTRAPVEVTTTFDKVFSSTLTVRPLLVLASWDLEVYSRSRRFPLAENEEDVIIQIATSFQRYGESEPYRKLIMAYQATDDVPGVEIMAFDDEADMINAWFDELLKEDVDIMLSYNGHQVGHPNTSSTMLQMQSSTYTSSSGSCAGSWGLVILGDAPCARLILCVVRLGVRVRSLAGARGRRHRHLARGSIQAGPQAHRRRRPGGAGAE